MFEHGAGGKDGGDPGRPERHGEDPLPEVGAYRHGQGQRGLATAAVQEKDHGAVMVVIVRVRVDPVMQTR